MLSTARIAATHARAMASSSSLTLLRPTFRAMSINSMYSTSMKKTTSTSTSFSTLNFFRRCSSDSSDNELPIVFDVESEEHLKEMITKIKKPLILDFHAEWCGPCKVLGPTLETEIKKVRGEVLMAKVNVDHNSELALAYNVSAIPAVIALVHGENVAHFTGVADAIAVREFIGDLVGQGNE